MIERLGPSAFVCTEGATIIGFPQPPASGLVER